MIRKLNSQKKGWICKGIPSKDKQDEYDSDPHEPRENFGQDCIICGLPKEAVVSGYAPNTPLPPGLKQRLAGICLMLVLVGGGALLVTQFPKILSLFNREQVSPIDSLSTYSNDLYGFRIKYPKSWQLEEINKKNSILNYTEVVEFIPQKEGDIYAQINIRIEEFSQPLTLDQYCSEVVIREIEEYSDYTIENSFECKISNLSGTKMLAQQPAYQVIYSGERLGKKVKVTEVFTLKGKNQAYIVTYTAEENHFDNFLQDVENIINSFEFL